MQLVSFQDLQKLAKNTTVNEQIFSNVSTQDIGNGLTFKKVCQEYKNKQQSLEKNNAKIEIRQTLHNYIKTDILKEYCPPIILVGSGSSRTVYACIGGKCIKVAKNDAGIAQNKQEIKYTKKHIFRKQYNCFVHTYESNGNDYGLLLSECCAQVKSKKQLIDAFGIEDYSIFNAIIAAVSKSKNFNINIATTKLKQYSNEYKKIDSMKKWSVVAEKASKYLEDLNEKKQSNRTIGESMLLELFLFWKKNGINELLPGDIQMEENWGFAIRNGKIAPVILDIGFSSNIYNKFY